MSEGQLKNDVAGEKLLRYFAPRTILYDVIVVYPHSLKGETSGEVDGLSARSMVMPVRVVYIPAQFKNKIAGQHEYLRSIGLGPDEVRFVKIPPGSSLLEAGLNDIDTRGETPAKSPLTLYGQSEGTQRVFEKRARARVKKSRTLSLSAALQKEKSSRGLSPLLVSGTAEGAANNKLFLRTVLSNRLKDTSDLNIDFLGVLHGQRIDDPALLTSVDKLLSKATGHAVVVKVVNWFSSDFVGFCSSTKEVMAFIRKTRNTFQKRFKDIEPDFLIEEDLSSEKDIEMSAQFLVDDAGEASFIRCTKNVVQSSMYGLRWRGNVVSGDSRHFLNNVSPADIKKITRVAEYFAKLGHRGYMGLDLLKLSSGALKLLEMNGRITGAAGALLALEKLMRQQQTTDLTVAHLQEIAPDPSLKLRNFEVLRTSIADLLYTNESSFGIVPTLVTPLPKHFGALFVGKNMEHVRTLQKELYTRLRIADRLVL